MKRETLFKIFKTAIESEREAYDFYSNAAGNTSDPYIKKIFEELAKTEYSHEINLMKSYKKLREATY